MLAVDLKEERAIMGISAKWIKSLVGIRKHEKGRNAECSAAVSHCAETQSPFVWDTSLMLTKMFYLNSSEVGTAFIVGMSLSSDTLIGVVVSLLLDSCAVGQVYSSIL